MFKRITDDDINFMEFNVVETRMDDMSSITRSSTSSSPVGKATGNNEATTTLPIYT
jgi:hypothetical protein